MRDTTVTNEFTNTSDLLIEAASMGEAVELLEDAPRSAAGDETVSTSRSLRRRCLGLRREELKPGRAFPAQRWPETSATKDRTDRRGGNDDPKPWSSALICILFRQKYPRWWFDWNLALFRFSNRVGIQLALITDSYPSTDEQQSVRLDIPSPDPGRNLNRWLEWFRPTC